MQPCRFSATPSCQEQKYHIQQTKYKPTVLNNYTCFEPNQFCGRIPTSRY